MLLPLLLLLLLLQKEKKVKKVFFHRRSENEKQKQTLHKLWKCHFLIKANPNLCHISDEVVSEEMGRRAVVTLDYGCKRPGFESLNPKRKKSFYSCYKYTVKNISFLLSTVDCWAAWIFFSWDGHLHYWTISAVASIRQCLLALSTFYIWKNHLKVKPSIEWNAS